MHKYIYFDFWELSFGKIYWQGLYILRRWEAFYDCIWSVSSVFITLPQQSFLVTHRSSWAKLGWFILIVMSYTVEVFTEDPRPEDPGPIRVRVYIFKGQPGPGRVPIYYFGSWVCLTLCVIPESIGEHRTRQGSASVSMRVCNLQFVKLGWEKYEREIRLKKKQRYLPPEAECGQG